MNELYVLEWQQNDGEWLPNLSQVSRYKQELESIASMYRTYRKPPYNWRVTTFVRKEEV